MKKVLAAIAVALVGASLYSFTGRAGVSCSVPFTFQNNTTADATQVNSNFSALVTCLASAATAGANSDITSLLGLTTPLSPSLGGTGVFLGGTTGGSANAQTLSTTTPNSFALTPPNRVTFIAGFTNTGTMTLAVGSTAAQTVQRKTQIGARNTQGGEVVAGNAYTAVYGPGGTYILDGETIHVGELRNWAGLTVPPGHLLADGTCVSQTTYAELFNIIGSTYDPGGLCNPVTQFRLPDGRGTAWVGLDTGNRLTTQCAANIIAGTNSNVMGTLCGVQQQTITQAKLPAVNLSVSSITVTSNQYRTVSSFQNGTGGSINYIAPDSGFTPVSDTVGGSVPLGGSGQALATLQPVQVINKIIRY